MRKPSRSNALGPPVSETMMSSKRRCARGRRRAGRIRWWIRVRTFVFRSNSGWVTPAVYAAAAKKSAMMDAADVWLAAPHSANAPSKRFP